MNLSSENSNYKALNEIHHYIDINRYEKALSKINELLSMSPNNGHLLYLSAFSYYKLDNYDEALKVCIESMTNGYSEEVIIGLMGRIYLETDKYVEAEEGFLKVLAINPQSAEIMAIYGYLMAKTGFQKKASLLLKEALRLEPENEVVLHYKSLYLLASNNKKEQEEVIKQLLLNSDNEVRKLVHLGLHDYYGGNYKSAKENFRQAYLLDPTNEKLLQMLKGVEKDNHFIFKPLLLVDKIGGPAVLWLTAIIITSILVYLELNTLLLIFIVLYLAYVVYSWTAVLIYKIFFK